MPIKAIQRFLKLEAAGGIVMMVAAVVAMLIENTPLHVPFHRILDYPVGFSWGGVSLIKPLLLWINDGLMSVFFLLVGLEIKREMLDGELSSFSKSLLPVIGAVGGMLVPALIYFMITVPDLAALKGWAIPTATDIAFALAILAILGDKVPASLKVFVAALAIFDDMGAILIIAVFYASSFSWLAFYYAVGCLGILTLFNRLNVTRFWPYLLVGLVLWVCVLKSGIHATLAGVLLALAIPMHSRRNPRYSPLRDLEHAIHPWVAFLVMPVFALANAGVSFEGMTLAQLTHPVSVGIMAGLFFGKQIGIFGATTLAVKMRLSPLPSGCQLGHLYGASLLCGVGFTMSLFIGMLAFDLSNPEFAPLVRLGVILGSLASGVLAYTVFGLLASKRA